MAPKSLIDPPGRTTISANNHRSSALTLLPLPVFCVSTVWRQVATVNP
jgi:hypothetical protein